MVGVPRSQACRNCKRKKKGCDLRRPGCGQCERLGLRCVYEERRWTFVNEAGPSSAPGTTVATPTREETVATPPLPTSQESLSRSAIETQVVDEFWVHYLPRDEPSAQHSVGGVIAAPWSRTLRDLASQDNTVRIALDAVALASIGRLREDESVMQQGTRLYARALFETNRNLQHPVRSQSEATLACCRALGIYETFRTGEAKLTSQGQDWQKHVDGTCRIIELRGPDRHVDSHGHELFLDARVAAVISGLTSRRTVAFESRAWNTVPWRASSRTLRDELLDGVIALPAILQKHDELSESIARRSTRPDTRLQLLHRGMELIDQCILVGSGLQAWERKALALCREHSPERDPTDLQTVCTQLGYGFFHVVMQYWVVCVVLFSQTWLAYRNVSQLASSVPQGLTARGLPTLPPFFNPHIYASAISAHCSHYFEPSAGLWGSQSAAFPMGAALHYFAATGGLHSPEIEAIRRVLRDKRLAGFTGSFLRSIATAAVPDEVKGDCGDQIEHQRMASYWYHGRNVNEE